MRKFYREAEPKLEFDPLWYRERERKLIAEGFCATVQQCGYTVWACAICSNHAHLIVRAHRDRGEIIWTQFAKSSAQLIRDAKIVPVRHSIWSHRPYKVFLHTWQEVVDRVKYVQDNPEKERLSAQTWDFVSPLPKQCARYLPSTPQPRDPRTQ